MNNADAVKQSTVLWAIAVAAGAAETILAVAEIAGEGALDAGVWINVGLRVLVYAGAALLVVGFSRGRRGARAGLAILLSVVGMGAMVVPSVMLMADGEGFMNAFGSDGDLGVAFLAVRMIHIAVVIGATVLMFTPSANAYFAKDRPLAPAAV